jgi:hypothetical protein
MVCPRSALGIPVKIGLIPTGSMMTKLLGVVCRIWLIFNNLHNNFFKFVTALQNKPAPSTNAALRFVRWR